MAVRMAAGSFAGSGAAIRPRQWNTDREARRCRKPSEQEARMRDLGRTEVEDRKGRDGQAVAEYDAGLLVATDRIPKPRAECA